MKSINNQFYTSYNQLDNAVNNIITINNKPLSADNELTYYYAVSAIHEISLAILNCQRAGLSKQQILGIIEPVNRLIGAAPFINRLQNWPRGYQGDFETIESLCNGNNTDEPNSFAQYAEAYILNCPIVQQHRNKVQQQAGMILSTVLNNTNPCHILSIASGSNRDIHSIAGFIKNRDVQFVLNDMDKDAIEFSRNRLHDIQDKCQFIQGNVMRKLRQFERLGAFDLVIAGGLFDYMSDEYIIYLLKNIVSKLLKPGGKLFFTNIASGNIYKVFMEYFGNWHLIERSEEDILMLIAATGVINENHVSIKRDTTGLAYLVEIG